MISISGIASRTYREIRHRVRFSKRDRSFVRQHMRYAVDIEASMSLPHWHFPLRGKINEISLCGLRFRPASTNILYREDTSCYITIDDFMFHGIIRNTTTKGYGIELIKEMDEQDLHKWLQIGREQLEAEQLDEKDGRSFLVG